MTAKLPASPGDPKSRASRWTDLRERARLQAAVVRLPEPQRDALMLWRFEGLGYEDIARALGTSVQAVKVQLWQARETLREAIAAPLGRGGLRGATGSG